MSKDMLGSVVRAAVGVPKDRLDTLAKLASAMSKDNPDGTRWHYLFQSALEEGLPIDRILAGIERNEYGHVTFTITGLHLTGAQELERLYEGRYRVETYAEWILRGQNPGSYDASHRLEGGKSYKIALLSGERHTTMASLLAEAGKFGYDKPCAGIIPRIREQISDRQMQVLDVQYISALHDPISANGGGGGLLNVSRNEGGRMVDAYSVGPGGHPCLDKGAFAFIVP